MDNFSTIKCMDSRLEMYNKKLKKVDGNSFTHREVDVLACIAHMRGDKKIGKLLGISYHTVSSHVASLLVKIGASSKDGILDFLEKTGSIQFLRKYYFYIQAHNLFLSHLNQIKSSAKSKKKKVYIKYEKKLLNNSERNKISQIAKILKSAGFEILSDFKNSDSDVVTIIHEKANSTNALCDPTFFKIEDKIEKNFDSNSLQISLNSEEKFFYSILNLIKVISNNTQIDEIIDQYDLKLCKLKTALSSYIFIQNDHNVEKKMPKLLGKGKKHYWAFLLFVLLFIFIMSIRHKEFYLSVQSYILDISKSSVSWNIPFLPQSYIHRDEIVDLIWDKFSSKKDNNSKVSVVGLYGLGGIGKTTIANFVVANSKKFYHFKGWFNAEFENQLRNEYFQLGQNFKIINSNMSEMEKIRAVKSWMEKQTDIMLVYDNVENLSFLKKYLPNKGDIIITSRSPNIPNPVEVTLMSIIDSKKLLKKLLPQNITHKANFEKDAEFLAYELDNLPLALSHAASYMAENFMTTEGYIKLYLLKKNEILQQKITSSLNYHDPAYITWNISLEKIKNDVRNTVTLKLMDHIGYLAPDKIPKKLLAQVLFEDTSNKQMQILEEVLQILKRYSLVKVSDNFITVHRLVQAWMKSKHNTQKANEIMKTSASAIKSVFPWKDKTYHNMNFLRLLYPHIDYIKKENDKKETVEVSIDILPSLAEYFFTYGDHGKSYLLLSEALAACNNYPKCNPKALNLILYNLGRSNIYLNSIYKAKDNLEKALKLSRIYFGEKSEEVADIYRYLGKVHLSLGNTILAENYYKKSVNIKAEILGANHPRTAVSMYSLGAYYNLCGDFILSNKILGVAKKNIEDYFGNDHVVVAYVLNHIAKNNLALGNYEVSSQQFQHLLSLKEHFNGENYIENAPSLYYMGVLNIELKKYTNSINFISKALQIRKIHSPENVTSTIPYLTVLGIANSYLKKHGKSVKQAIDVMELLSKDNNFTISEKSGILNNIALIFLLSGETKRALKLFEESILLLQDSDEHRLLKSKILANKANLYRIEKRFLESEQMLVKAYNNFKEDKKNNIEPIIKCGVNLFLLYSETNEQDKKMRILDELNNLTKNEMDSSNPLKKKINIYANKTKEIGEIIIISIFQH